MNWNYIAFKRWLFVDAIWIEWAWDVCLVKCINFKQLQHQFLWTFLTSDSLRIIPSAANLLLSLWEWILSAILWCCQQSAISSPLLASLLHSLLSLEDNSHQNNNHSFCNCRSFQQSLIWRRWYFSADSSLSSLHFLLLLWINFIF